MNVLTEQDLTVLALTSRLVDTSAKPLSAREFWALSKQLPLSELRLLSADEAALRLGADVDQLERIHQLLSRSASLAFALEELEHSGIWTIASTASAYPERLRHRLGDKAPPVLHGVGDITILRTDGVGVVGSRNVTEDGSRIAKDIARLAVQAELPVISGAARGVDSDAMNAACEAGGQVVGVLADSLERTVSKPRLRREITAGNICLITPYHPSAPFSVGNAMGRNKIIYGLSRCTVVVASDHGKGGTWQGAVEALEHRYGRVAAWTGIGSCPGNTPLIEQGAVDLRDLDQLPQMLSGSNQPTTARNETPQNQQLTLGY